MFIRIRRKYLQSTRKQKMCILMDTHGKTQLIAFTGNTEAFTEQTMKIVTLPAKNRKITVPAGTRWVETLSNPKKPNIWEGKGPSFDSYNPFWETNKSFWRILDNGYMTHYKNDEERAEAMFCDNPVDMTQTFNGSCNHERMRYDDWYDDGNRSDGKRGRNDRYKAKQSTKLSLVCPQTTRKMKTDADWAAEHHF